MVTRIANGINDHGRIGGDEDEFGAGIESLLNEAAAVDAGQKPQTRPPDPEVEAKANALATTNEAREAVHFVAALALPLVAYKWGPEVAALYGAGQLDAIGDALGRVAVKRGWSLDSIMSGYGPELALCAALASPCLPLLLAKAAASRKAPAPDKPERLDDPGLEAIQPVTPHDGG